MLQENERARIEDANVLNARFDVMANNHIELRRTLGKPSQSALRKK
jgi:hypothetical protein